MNRKKKTGSRAKRRKKASAARKKTSRKGTARSARKQTGAKSAKEPGAATRLPRPSCPVVGIGASAGGLDAFKRFLGEMPPDSGIALVLVPHLDPNHESLMVELLAKQTRMPICEAEDGMEIEPDHVYVIPPNHYLSIRDGTLRLSDPAQPQPMQTAIDTFFRSLADELGERAIGIVLSGTSSHGAQGLKEIKLAGGMVMVQEPGSAQYDQMPRSAIATGLVDYVLRPEDMPAALVGYVRHAYVNGEAAAGVAGEKASQQLNRILALLRMHTKYDFRSYRPSMLFRRIQRRMGLCHLSEIPDYLAYLRDNPPELAALYKDLLIGVTSFFREPEAFHVLEEEVLPVLVGRADDERPLRIWVPGCATGEEAYTIAILVAEAFASADKDPSFQIFATDIDDGALEIARQGTYSESVAADVTPARLSKFFVKADEHRYQVSKQLRESIVFAAQNLVSDAPFSRLDLISCRNVLIYLQEEVQVKVIRLLHFALNADGYLLLGPSESIGRAVDLFEPVSKKWRIFRRIGPIRRELVEIPIVAMKPEQRPVVPRPETTQTVRFDDLTLQMIVDEYAPAAALINRQYEILSVIGPLVNFLEFPRGRITKDLLAMARQGLRTKIRAAVHRAIEENQTVTDEDARVKRNGVIVGCSITVRPVHQPKEAEGLLLVTFEDRAAVARGVDGDASVPAGRLGTPGNGILAQLEYDLKTTREELQSTVEEYESANEELKASNEEIMSMNEELQSTNEELETSKEELQSLNEELTTVNNQLTDKVDQLDKANADMTNLLASNDIATVFLDRDLRIRMFTPVTGTLLSLVSTDVGRPITDFSSQVANEDLVSDAGRVLDKLAPVEREIRSESGKSYLRRIVPYRSADNRIEGVVVSFFQVTELKRAESKLRDLNTELEARVGERTSEALASAEQLRAVVDTAVDAIITIDHAGIIRSFNPAAERMFGYGEAEAIGQNVKMLMPSPYREEHDGYLARYLETREARIIGIGREVKGRRKDGSTFPLDLAVSEIHHLGLFNGVLRDISERKRHENEFAQSEERLRALTQRLLTVQEEERRHISRELHDVVGQRLTLLRMQIDQIEVSHFEGHSEGGIESLRELVESIADTVRELSHQLHPSAVEHLGIVVALRKECDTVSKTSGRTIRFRAGDNVPRRIPLDAAMCLYRVGQEALQNAVKHAGGDRVDVSLETRDGGVALSVVDFGGGFEIGGGTEAGPGLGLVSMEERARAVGGELAVHSVPGKGTRVRCWVPLPFRGEPE